MRPKRSPLLLLLSLASLLTGCGKDDANSSHSPPDSGMNAAETFTPPRGGFDRDDEDAINEPAPVNLPPAQPVDDATRTQCGEVSCRDVLVGDIVVPPCCPGGATDRCGLNLTVVEP